MEEKEILEFTESIIEKQQRLLSNNYMPLSKDQILTIYRELF